jgi:type II secretory pathway pseudopilin PulG
MEMRTAVDTKKSGLTLVEILVVVGIITLLVGMLLPAVHTVHKMAKETKQKAQLTTIELGLAGFKNDYGDYPPSTWMDPDVPDPRLDPSYCGAQKLAEALFGWDLMGFHPASTWRAGASESLPPPVYATPDTLEKRRGRYIELEAANVFRLGRTPKSDGLFVDTRPLAPHTYVLCDVFPVNERKVVLGSGKTVSPGTPILYYKADPAKRRLDDFVKPENNIYNARDNWPLLSLGKLARTGKPLNPLTDVHPLEGAGVGWEPFYQYVRDPKIQARIWPYRPDSYLLISAGADGLYGTGDDICNFGH